VDNADPQVHTDRQTTHRHRQTVIQRASIEQRTSGGPTGGQRRPAVMDCTLGTTDRLSSASLLMGVESNSGAADARAVVTWPGAEVAVRLNPLPDCSFVFQSFDSRIFELGDCCMAQSSPDE